MNFRASLRDPVTWCHHSSGLSRVAQDHPVIGPYLEMVTRLPMYARLGADLARDPDVPATAKASLVAAGAYAISPIDLVPGIIPIAGQMDDLAALLLAIRFAVRMTPKEVAFPHLERAGITTQQIDDDLKAVRDTDDLAGQAGGQRRALVRDKWRDPVSANLRRWQPADSRPGDGARRAPLYSKGRRNCDCHVIPNLARCAALCSDALLRSTRLRDIATDRLGPLSTRRRTRILA